MFYSLTIGKSSRKGSLIPAFTKVVQFEGTTNELYNEAKKRYEGFDIVVSDIEAFEPWPIEKKEDKKVKTVEIKSSNSYGRSYVFTARKAFTEEEKKEYLDLSELRDEYFVKKNEFEKKVSKRLSDEHFGLPCEFNSNFNAGNKEDAIVTIKVSAFETALEENSI